MGTFFSVSTLQSVHIKKKNVWTWGFQGEIHWLNYVWENHSKLKRFEMRFENRNKKQKHQEARHEMLENK